MNLQLNNGKLLGTLMSAGMGVILAGCAGASTADYQSNVLGMDNYLLPPALAAEALQNPEKSKNLQIIDVRTPEEFDESCLKGAKMIDIRSADFDQQIAALDKEASYLVYCRSGRRSADAVAKMRAAGIKDILEIEGGIASWQQNGLPVEKNCS